MIRVVTDSTSDLLPDRAAELGVEVVPLTVRFGEEQFRDGVDLSPDDFYARLPSAVQQPTTSQPSPEDFAAVYRRLVSAGDEVVSLHIAGRLSGTLQSASLAAQEFGAAVRVVDSGTVSAGIQFLVLDALADAAAGASAAEVVRGVEERRGRVELLVLVDTLTYLHRGGRIGRAQNLLGSILNVKPVLRVAAGEVHPHARVRSRQQGLAVLLRSIAEAGPIQRLAVFHCGAPDLLTGLEPQLRAAHPEVPLLAGQLGAVVGTYSGPHGIGVGFLRAT